MDKYDDFVDNSYTKVIEGLKTYKVRFEKVLKSHQDLYNSIAKHEKIFYQDSSIQLQMLKHCTKVNSDYFNILSDFVYDDEESLEFFRYDLKRFNFVLKLIARDWSPDYELERSCWFGPIIKTLEKSFESADRDNKKILCLGDGLLRLPLELCRKGFITDGVMEDILKISIASHLNKLTEINAFTIYPFVDKWSDLVSSVGQQKPVTFPDITFDMEDSQEELDLTREPTVIAARFLADYDPSMNQEKVDAVATSGYFNLSRNIPLIISTIHHNLRSGGIWVNNGPLINDYDVDYDSKSCFREWGYDDIKKALRKQGFTILSYNHEERSTFCYNRYYMSNEVYEMLFFIVRK
ncbi:DgyrCDS7730 [Dimorphilus gyrociliatus]|uniref:carnosine N-methyltransferase n=1 Tax=Dimorphilus gyrociliatus TaxID=2664684 RepID=A0A7I8VU61_9ANNE|nr:DgyrCDS7730 [Dimorphilus gyrociliatus]